MLNPSTADAQQDDPTIRRCINYSRSWGYTGMEVGNLFAWRATQPNDLLAAADPIGPENDNILRQQIRRADFIMLGWGTHGHYYGRDLAVLRIIASLKVKVYCFGVTRNGAPKHPLYLKKNLLPVSFNMGRVPE